MPCETHLCKHSENPPLWVIKSELLWIPSTYSSKPNHSKSAEISQLWSQFLAITGMLSLSYLNHSIDQFNQKSKAFMNQFLKLFHTKHENFLADRNFFAMFCLALCLVPSFLWSLANTNWPRYKANGLLSLLEICCINDEVLHQFFMKASLQASSPESSCLQVISRMKEAEVIPNK